MKVTIRGDYRCNSKITSHAYIVVYEVGNSTISATLIKHRNNKYLKKYIQRHKASVVHQCCRWTVDIDKAITTSTKQ